LSSAGWDECEGGSTEVVGVVHLSPQLTVECFGMNLYLLHVDEDSEDQLVIAVIIDDTSIVAATRSWRKSTR